MRLQIIHLGDIHVGEDTNSLNVHIKEMDSAINTIHESDEICNCVVVISGDIAYSGIDAEYQNAKNILNQILYMLCQRYQKEKINVFCVPGNHDLNFKKINRDGTTPKGVQILEKAFDNQIIDSVVLNDLEGMDSFFRFCTSYQCFDEGRLISKKILEIDSSKIGFVMLNTAPNSLLGGKQEDMGMHYLSDMEINSIAKATEADINILIMHHSLEWFSPSCKNQLRCAISENYTLVLSGHEHISVGESRNINKTGNLQWIQGNALYDPSASENGFCIVDMNLNSNKITGYSAIWEQDFYKTEEIIEGMIKKSFRGVFRSTVDFGSELICDNERQYIDQYFVFPSFSYNFIGNQDTYNIDSEQEFWKLLKKHDRIYIYGDFKSGKTTLAKKIYRKLLEVKKVPIYLSATEMEHKNVDKIVQYAFTEQYVSNNSEYDKFLQLAVNQKIVIIDEAEKLNNNSLKNLLSVMDKNFSKIIVLGDDMLNLNIRDQVMNALMESMTIQVSIKPFLYSKRKLLIENTLRMINVNSDNIPIETRKINDLINSQLRYFNLAPDFIIKFIIQYEQEYNLFSSSKNVFSMVYETSIKNSIIRISQEKEIAPELVLNIMCEVSYYMHFGKKRVMSSSEIGNIIDKYKSEYRQKISLLAFLDIAIKSKIMVENDDSYRFKDHTLTAYFVAQALSRKAHQKNFNIKGDIDILLQNLCFSINGDIMLFLALITNNPEFVYCIADGAKKHFQGQQELSFDKENIPFLSNTLLPVKNSLPTENEKYVHENNLTKEEEKEKTSAVIELIDEYNYTEEDLKKFKNQALISFKYIKLLSQALPAFCPSIPANQQDILVELLYKCPNQVLFYILTEINDVFDEYAQSLYDEVMELNHEKNEIEINLKNIKKMIEQVSSVFALSLYQMVAATATSMQTIQALDAFDYNQNSNYQLQNFMMHSRLDNLDKFSERAISLNKKTKKKIEKSFIKYTVRNYILRNHDILTLHGKGDVLISYFFKDKDVQNQLRENLLKNKFLNRY